MSKYIKTKVSFFFSRAIQKADTNFTELLKPRTRSCRDLDLHVWDEECRFLSLEMIILSVMFTVSAVSCDLFPV